MEIHDFALDFLKSMLTNPEIVNAGDQGDKKKALELVRSSYDLAEIYMVVRAKRTKEL